MIESAIQVNSKILIIRQVCELFFNVKAENVGKE